MTNDQKHGFRSEDIALDSLVISESNVRQRDITADIDELAASMDRYGLQQPIVAQETGDGQYEIVIGQRRYWAAKQLGWEKIAARVRIEPMDPFEAKVVSFSENVQRRDLAPRDKADVCRTMLDQLHSVSAVAHELRISEPSVRKWLGYSAVPDGLKKLVQEKKISVPMATRLAQHVSKEAAAIEIAENIAELNPAPPERARILEAVEEIPDRPFEAILRRAEEKRLEKEIRFVLPPRWSEELDRVSGDLGKDSNDVARDATIEWLQLRA